MLGRCTVAPPTCNWTVYSPSGLKASHQMHLVLYNLISMYSYTLLCHSRQVCTDVELLSGVRRAVLPLLCTEPLLSYWGSLWGQSSVPDAPGVPETLTNLPAICCSLTGCAHCDGSQGILPSLKVCCTHIHVVKQPFKTCVKYMHSCFWNNLHLPITQVVP